MTFLEKLLENYPDAVIEDVMEFDCPSNYGYAREIPCRIERNEYICRRCWEREIPCTEPVKAEDYCRWEYDEYEDSWKTECGTMFKLHDEDREDIRFCASCGKKIKVEP